MAAAKREGGGVNDDHPGEPLDAEIGDAPQ